MGTPSSHLILDVHDEAARRAGIRLISYSRPGYSGSSPWPGRRVVDAGADVEAIADGLGIGGFGLWGWSGGGPFALGAAACLPDRVTRAVALASPAPGMPPSVPFDETLDYEAERGTMLAGTVDDWLTGLKPEFAAFAPFAIATLHLALADSAEGWIEDDRAMGGDWGFDPASIRVPVRYRHGREDRSVPIANGEWLAARISNVDARFSDNDNHQATHFLHLDEDFAWLSGAPAHL
jgi:pimeloyl-ACP methyl ester carboxylesterase